MRGDDLTIARANLQTPAARGLISALNAELSALYPEQGANHFRLDPEEVEGDRGAFFLATASGTPVGCGAVRRIAEATGEIKRMFVLPSHRGRGVGRAMLTALEREARALGLSWLVLETGARQEAAIALYGRAGFTTVAPFGEYAGSPLSVCMEKEIR